jgi:CO/xanthine dehydrogenase Mo-binding subunit
MNNRWIGKPIHPAEDRRFVTGRGHYLPNVSFPNMLYGAISRSIHAHARILSIDVREARAMPGVFFVVTGAAAKALSKPLRSLIPLPLEAPSYCLASEKVRYVGEPVAAIAAASRYIAEDALEKIRVEYEPVPATVDPEEAMKPGAPLLFEQLGSNVLWHDCFN